MQNSDLSKREKILLLILLCGIIVFVYSYLIRRRVNEKIDELEFTISDFDGRISECNSSESKSVDNLVDEEKLKEVVEENKGKYGDFTNLELILNNYGVDILNMSSGFSKHSNFEDTSISKVVNTYSISSDLSTLSEVLKEISNIDGYIIDDIGLKRDTKTEFEMSFSASTLSLEDLPESAISFESINTQEASQNTSSDEENLSNKVYSKDKELLVNSNSKNSETKTSKADTKPDAKSENKIDTKADAKSESKNYLPIEEIEAVELGIIDKLNNIAGGKYNSLSGYDYIKNIIKNDNLSEFIEWNGVDLVYSSKGDSGTIDFSINPIKIENYFESYLIDICPNNKIDLIALSYRNSIGEVKEIVIKNISEGWNTYEFYIPDNKSAFPLEILNFECKSESEVKIKGLLGVNR